jgi:hypothetical protein
MISVSNFSWAKEETAMITGSRLLNNNNVFITHLLWKLKIFETPWVLYRLHLENQAMGHWG